MRTTRILVATAIATLTACGGGGDTPTITTPTPPVVAAVASVTVTPDAMQLLAPATLQLTAAMKDAAGNGLTNRAVAWSTSQAVVATVSADGMVTALGPGTTVVTATSEGRSGNATITVTAPPSALSVSQGSGQTGEPGLALPIRPAVIVRDAQARPVANVSVTFVIDSGGGSLASTQATSGSDGVATAGVWTLGQSEGRNVVLATTTGLAGVRVTATGTYPNVAIGQSQVSLAGGVITVARPGSALNGMRVEIPDSAFLSPVSMTIRQRSSAGLALQEPGPAALLRPVSNAFALAAGGAPAITPIITIVTNGPPSASGELLLKVPVPIGTISPRVAVVDSVGTPVAFLPIVASDSTSVTVTTRALSTSVLTQIGNIPQTLPSGSQSLSIVLFAGRAGSSLAQLYPYSFGVGFTHGVHNLGFYDLKTTYETQIGPGMMLAEWAGFYLQPGGLFHKLDRATFVTLSDSRGIMMSAGLGRAFWGAMGRYGAWYLAYYRSIAVPTSSYDRRMAEAMILALYYGRGPIPVILTDGVHTRLVNVIEWDATNTRFRVREPAFSGPQWLTFAPNGAMQPYTDPYSPQIQYSTVYYNYSWMAGFWPLAAATVANASNASAPEPYSGGFRAAQFESWSSIIRRTRPDVPDTVFLAGDTTRIWPVTQSPPVSFGSVLPVPVGFSQQNAFVYGQNSSGWMPTPVTFGTSYLIDFTAYPNGAVQTIGLAVEEKTSTVSAQDAWAGWRELHVVKFGIAITANMQVPGAPSTFTPSTKGGSPAVPSTAKYEWDFGDGTAKQTVTGPSAINHTYTTSGSFTIVLRILHPTQNLVMARATTTESNSTSIWRLTFFSINQLLVPGALLPAPGANFTDAGNIKNSDHVTWYKADSALLKRLVAQPATGLLVLLKTPVTINAVTYRAGLYLQSDPAGTPGKAASFDPTQTLIPLAQTFQAPGPDTYAPPLLQEPYADTFTSTSGGITGSSIVAIRDFTGLSAVLVAPQRKRTLLAWTVAGTHNGTQLSGTMSRTQSLWVYAPGTPAQGMYWYNLFTYQLSFGAIRVP